MIRKVVQIRISVMVRFVYILMLAVLCYTFSSVHSSIPHEGLDHHHSHILSSGLAKKPCRTHHMPTSEDCDSGTHHHSCHQNYLIPQYLSIKYFSRWHLLPPLHPGILLPNGISSRLERPPQASFLVV